MKGGCERDGVVVSKSAVARARNRRLVEKANLYRFVSRLPLLCECDDPQCEATLLVGFDDYRRAERAGALLTVPGHLVLDAESGPHGPEYWIYHPRLAENHEQTLH